MLYTLTFSKIVHVFFCYNYQNLFFLLDRSMPSNCLDWVLRFTPAIWRLWSACSACSQTWVSEILQCSMGVWKRLKWPLRSFRGEPSHCISAININWMPSKLACTCSRYDASLPAAQQQDLDLSKPLFTTSALYAACKWVQIAVMSHCHRVK